MKVCQECGLKKSLESFKTNHHHCKVCKECLLLKKRVIASNPERKERRRDLQYKRRYGITSLEYDKLLLKQGNSCAICKTHISELSVRLHVDHNHTTGKIRGLLCFNCNQGLGRFQDDINFLDEAKNYLVLHEKS